jgi:hypothetical protein
MTTDKHFPPGTLLAVPVTKGSWALIKVLYRSKRSGGLYCVGMAPTALDAPTRPATLPAEGEWRHLDSDKGWVQLVDDRVLDHWEDFMGLGPLVELGHDASPIPRALRLLCMGSSVYEVDEYVGPKKQGDGVGDLSGALVLPFMWALQRMLGVPKLGPALKRVDASGHAIPMGDDQFWGLIEKAWAKQKAEAKRRLELLAKDPRAMGELVESKVKPWISEYLSKLDHEDAAAFGETLAEKLYRLDRRDLADVLDAGPDGFLGGRCFVVAMGREYFEMVVADPTQAVPGPQVERLTGVVRALWRRRYYVDPPVPKHPIATGSNPAGWGSAGERSHGRDEAS